MPLWPFCRGGMSPTSRSSTTAFSAVGSSIAAAVDDEASAVVAEAVTGSHVLEIRGYSLTTEAIGNGQPVKSSTFRACGHRWKIWYYPNGYNQDSVDWISLFLHHDGADMDVINAGFMFSVLDDAGEPVPTLSVGSSTAFFSPFSAKSREFGYNKFVKREDVEESACVKDDCLRIRCDIAVAKPIRREAGTQFVVVPPQDMHRQIGRLFSSGEGRDVTFVVAGEEFPAHRCVLAARSSVFRAELLGAMKEKAMDRIEIFDMEPRVFKAMLHFMYTDTVPEFVDEEDDEFELFQHLLVAADRYDLERLKRICEKKLCSDMDASTVATALALAERHGCRGLKKACFKLLMYPSHLKTAMATEGFDHLMIARRLSRSCWPRLLADDMSNTAALVVGSGDGHGDEEVLTASAIVAESMAGSHVLEIKGYSLTKGLGNGKCITSSAFSVGGHRWCIRYYPDGHTSDSADWISMFVQLDLAADEAADVKAEFQFSVLDDISELVPKFSSKSLKMYTFSAKTPSWGSMKSVERRALEESGYVKHDCLRIRCDITVSKNIRTEAAATRQFVVVPPSDMHQHFGRLLSSGDGTTDVTFEVAGEMFPAHRCVRAARSSVFMADLFGSIKKKAKDNRRIDGMEARVFKAMLHFIYKDAMPEIDTEDAFVITQHLLVAADRYDLERLKLVCEEKLCSYIDTTTVAATLTLAEQHGCHGLKKSCFKLLQQSPCLLKIVMTTEGFDHLIRSCPSLIKELLAKRRWAWRRRRGAHRVGYRRRVRYWVACPRDQGVLYYSLTKGLGIGKCITSSAFSVGGHRWCIKYYPDGETSDSADWISIFLQLNHTADDALDVKAQFKAASVLNDIGEPVPTFSRTSSKMDTFCAKSPSWGFSKFAERKTLEESVYVKDDCLRIRCDVTVTKNIRTEAATHQFVVVPPSDMHQHFGRLLSSTEGTTDLTFEVAGEMFPAHRCVLAARSSVFMAELFGSMKERRR
ncbi:LOW QUALITY PROTEIN: hypothetical protein U9M48_001610 [Paspalum notatum var. saurae]|uniref:Uncharacterized protein n=1 Tax=Paspalum notatum var. saurae TaxID=547442 RepID=A0AAQ3PIK0_PASNO